MIVFLLAGIAAAATAFVLQPVFGRTESGGPTGSDRTALRLMEKRDQLLAALAELDFERDAGKIAEGEHRTSRRQLLVEAASVTRQLEARDGTGPGGEKSG